MDTERREPSRYDVFVSYNAQDQDAALELCDELERRGIRPWIAPRDSVPGQLWQEQLDRILGAMPAAAVLVGAAGLGPWEDLEQQAALMEFTKRRTPVIPVLLADAPAEPRLPVFLRAFTWVDLRVESFDRLVLGIEAARPSPPDGGTAGGPSATLAAWLNQVAADHRRLADHFERPVELQDIERAWVCLELALPEAEHRDVLARRTLDDFLALDPEEHEWITRRWLVEGDPGSGKTTLLRHLAGRLARADEPQSGQLRSVPIFVSLPRVVKPPRPLLDYLDEEYGGFCGAELSGVLDREGREGRLLVLLDGLDEVPPERRERVERLLARIEADWPKSSIVLTSRPLGMGRVPHGFRKLLLQPLDDVQRGRFLEKWFGHREASDPAAEAELAARHFDSERSLRELSHNPLHLTLLTVLWEKGVKAPTRRSELYDEIFRLLLEGRHKSPPVPIQATEDVRQALRHLAFGLTRDDLPGQTPGQLEQRLREGEVKELRERLETAWPETLGAFFTDVAERTYILGPHDGPRAAWRFWHRGFREALTAERLLENYDSEGEDVVLSQVEDVVGDLGRWAEPYSLLAGRLADPDALVHALVEANRPLGLRALATAQGLKPDTVAAILGLTEDWRDRRKVFESIPDLVGDPETCLALVGRLRNDTRDGNDLFFLYRAAEDVAERWEDLDGHVRQLLARFFDHIPAPEDPELFRTVETPIDGRVELWREIPAGEGSVGSPEGVGYEHERPRHRIAVERPFCLSAVPVTNAQYAAFEPDKPFRKWNGVAQEELPYHPRVDVSWYEAVSFCRWLSKRGFQGARLPAEEEWEYACRAGSNTTYWSGDGETDLVEVGWYGEGLSGSTHRVGGKKGNPWGLYDVHGNVWEWTSSTWDKEKYESRPKDRPLAVDPADEPADLVASPSAWRVLRGGCFWQPAVSPRSACRGHWDPKSEMWDRGFRVLLPSAPRRRVYRS